MAHSKKKSGDVRIDSCAGLSCALWSAWHPCHCRSIYEYHPSVVATAENAPVVSQAPCRRWVCPTENPCLNRRTLGGHEGAWISSFLCRSLTPCLRNFREALGVKEGIQGQEQETLQTSEFGRRYTGRMFWGALWILGENMGNGPGRD